MADHFRITPAQEAILNTFTCERLTAHTENRESIKNFSSKYRTSLVDKLRNDAWQEDLDGMPAVYYVVKSADGQIALYFSLKCGTLCDLNYVAKVFERFDQGRELMAALNGQESSEWAKEYVKQHCGGSGPITYRDRMNILSGYWDAADDFKDIGCEKTDDPGDRIVRVDEAFPAVELVHFCVNEKFRPRWKELNLGHGMGEVFFWWFIVPKMLEIQAVAGCEYAYLFAADTSLDGTLVNYYENALHFECTTRIGGIKPWYDYFCKFMCRRLLPLSDFRRSKLKSGSYDEKNQKGLTDYRAYFLDHFNEVPAMV